MQIPKSGLALVLAALIIIATAAGLTATYRRFHVEESNRRVEIALEWQEVALLSQAAGRPVDQVLALFKHEQVTTLVIAEDTIASLELSGSVRPSRILMNSTRSATVVQVDVQANFQRIVSALKLRGLSATIVADNPPVDTRTVFQFSDVPGSSSRPEANARASRRVSIATPVDYTILRSVGIGMPPDALDAAKAAGMRIAGRIGNFPGVNVTSARASLARLGAQGASTVIFNGDEVLGYRGLEKDVAAMLRGSDPRKIQPATSDGADGTPPSAIPVYGAVEFGKQKGDETLSNELHGDYVRVHSIQAAEMGQMEKREAVDRFVRAAKERNIRFCYVRLLTFAGENAVDENANFLHDIARGIAHGSIAAGGGMGFGPARRFADSGVSAVLFGLIALGAAAGTVWMLRALAPFPLGLQVIVLGALCIFCIAAATLLDETGRKLVAFLAGIVYPTIACLVTFPSKRTSKRPLYLDDTGTGLPAESPSESLRLALRGLGVASLITAVGIVQVVGMLATRPFMLRANQFLGIKAQHAIPLLIVALVALAGGVAGADSWEQFRVRAMRRIREAMSEPARFGTLALAIVALAALALVVARTGNDAGVGVSGTELKVRALLDRILPVRPRTKEFLVGHPALVLALAWWWRGRRRLAIPAFVVGSLGQVSLLNTFCHIHTPLIISAWRDGLGLFFGALLGAAIFLGIELLYGAAARRSGKASGALPLHEPE